MPTLLYKWLKSENTSSKGSRKIAKLTIKRLGITPRQYRLMLATGRDYLRVVETRMSAKEWQEIDYSQVPSVAMNRYRKAFHNQDGERFREFLGKVEKGEAKINAGTLYPYDIVEKLMYDRNSTGREVLEAQWKALPNYVDGNHNVLIMADVSGSMSGRPLATSIGLAIYFAERNHGPYQDLFMTFSRTPEFVKLKGHNLETRIRNAAKAEWNANTNLNSAFLAVLKLALDNNLSKEDLPSAIVVISDMEIDCADRENKFGFLDKLRILFANHGYVLPKLVFWNVNSRNDTFLISGNWPGATLASGQSTSTFRHILSSINLTPYQAMLKVLSDERYQCINVPEQYKGSVGGSLAPARESVNRSVEDIRARRADAVGRLFSF